MVGNRTKQRLIGGLCAASLAAIIAAPVATSAKEATVYRAHRGAIVFQAKPFGDLTDGDAFAAAIKRASKNHSLSASGDGGWAFHFIAFLNKSPGAQKVNLVFYREGDKKRSPVDFVEYTLGDPRGKLLQASATLNPDNGFKAGDRIVAHITRLIGGKEKRYASAKFTLKK